MVRIWEWKRLKFSAISSENPSSVNHLHSLHEDRMGQQPGGQGKSRIRIMERPYKTPIDVFDDERTTSTKLYISEIDGNCGVEIT